MALILTFPESVEQISQGCRGNKTKATREGLKSFQASAVTKLQTQGAPLAQGSRHQQDTTVKSNISNSSLTGDLCSISLISFFFS